MTVMIVSLIGIISVKAEEISYSGQFRLQFYSLATGTTALTNVGNFDTAQQLSSGYGVSKIITRYSGITFKKDTKYRVTTIVGFAPVDITQSFTYVDNIGCFGTASTSNWSADSSLIKSCEIVNIERVPNQNRVKYTVDITPKNNVPGIQFNINTSITEEVRVVNVYTASSISVADNVIGAITEQTEEITNVIEEANEELINVITGQNTTCKTITIDKNTNGNKNGSLASNCTQAASTSSLLTKYIPVNNESVANGLRTGASYCFYDENKTAIGTKTSTSATSITIPNNAKYIRFQIANTNYEYANVKTCSTNTEAILDQDYEYEENVDQSVTDYENTQQSINNQLDLDTTNKINIALDTNSNNFIWMIFDSLKNVNGKIILFFNSLMALGIIKLILGR